MSRFPFGIPNSWYVVGYSHELAAGQVERLHVFDRELVLFRGEGGRAAVLDAYCPHLGAHLGVGGRVMGDTIRCPFHGWRWTLEGKCAAVPYARRIPSGVEVGAYPVVERNGMIFVWYHAEGAAPDFEIPVIAQWQQDDWLGAWLQWDWTVNSHPQDIAENGIDWAHFTQVHGMEVPEQRECAFAPHTYTWQIGGSKAVSTLGGQPDDLVMYGENWGMGYSWMRQVGRFETIVATGMTPIDGETTRIRMAVIARVGDRSESETRDAVRRYMDEHAVFAEQDFAIWENKVFRERPGLCEDDGPISDYRRWAAQFYG